MHKRDITRLLLTGVWLLALCVVIYNDRHNIVVGTLDIVLFGYVAYAYNQLTKGDE